MAVDRTKQRGRRAALAIFALALAGFGTWHAAATALSGESPAVVQKMDPTNADALPMLVDLQSAKTKALGLPLPRMVPLLRKALANQPLTPRILRQLAAFDDKQGEDQASRRLLALGERVSRRDPFLNVMLARNAATDRRPADLVRHVDAALSTFRSADEQIFPLLANALSSAEFRSYLKGYMDRPWAEPFMLYAAQNARPADVLDLALSAPLVQQRPRFERFRTELVSHLVAGGASDRALAYVRTIAPERAALDTAAISKATVDARFAPVTWRLTNASGIYVSQEGSRLAVAVDPAARGRAMERVMALRPGTYRLVVRATTPTGQASLHRTWTVACLRGVDEQVLGQRELSGQSGAITLAFAVPSGCDSTRLALDLVNGSEQSPADFDSEAIELQPGAGA